MLLLKNNVKPLTQSNGWVRNLGRNLNSSYMMGLSVRPILRSYTSSFSNGKGHDNSNNSNSNNQNRSANATEDEEKISNSTDTQQDPFVGKQPPSSSPLESSFSFMPVINIPQTEFAHNAFFSLHRPLLGLADEEEKPFFSKHPPAEDDDGKEDNDILVCNTD